MVGCVEGILGLRPDINGLRLSPAIPSSWKSFSVEKTFRGKKLRITVHNPAGRESGCTQLTVNGTAIEGSGGYIPASILKADNEITLEM
jgi:cellobiose phosphorylase